MIWNPEDRAATRAAAQATYDECTKLLSAGNYAAAVTRISKSIERIEESEDASRTVPGSLALLYGMRATAYQGFSGRRDRELLTRALEDVEQALQHASAAQELAPGFIAKMERTRTSIQRDVKSGPKLSGDARLFVGLQQGYPILLMVSGVIGALGGVGIMAGGDGTGACLLVPGLAMVAVGFFLYRAARRSTTPDGPPKHG